MKQKLIKKTIVISILALSMLASGSYQQSQSANLTNTSVTLSNSRLSFVGALDTGNAEGSSQVIVETTTGDYPSTTSAQLVIGDTLAIGESGSLGSYTITDVVSTSTLNITPVLATGDADEDDVVISTQSATQTVRFTTANAIANGRIRILVPALASDTMSADGIPDAGEFDFGSTAPTVTCPSDISNYNFVGGTATASAVTIGSQEYHSYECAYSGSGAIGTAFDGSTNDAITINSIINPAPKTAHATGLADTYKVIVQHLDSNFSVADSTTTSIGVIEAVKITASVAPQITFQISGIASGTTACGLSTDVTTTPTSVPFGELSISAFTNAAQALSVSTNAANGYSVTALANDQLGKNGDTCTGDNTGSNCIPDSVGDNTSMSHTASDEWTSTATKGFAYSLDDVNTSGTTPAFEYDTASGNCSGTYCARQFADQENSQSAQTIFSSSSVADNHNLYVCYKSVISSTQSAGEYESHITYTATATF